MPKAKKTTKAGSGRSTEKKEKVKKTKKTKKVTKKKAPAKKGVLIKKKEIKRVPKPAVKAARFLGTVGRRKTAVARIRLWTQGEKAFSVNNRPYQEYFPTLELQQIAAAPFNKMRCLDKFKVSVKVRGGGFRAQAEAVRHGTARALVKFNPDFRKRLKKAGFLTRDPRMKERRKPGLKKARRAPQWQKR